MSNSKISPNEEDLTAVWLNLDTEYNITKNQKYRTFRQKYLSLHPNFFMQLQTSYLNFVHFVTKNAIAATAVCLIALTAVSASAAQLVAPNEYKPSTIASNFFANKQTDKNPYTALKPDKDNDVVISDKCNLAIKYPKTFDGKKVAVEKNILNYLGDKTMTENAEDLLIRPQQSLEDQYVYYSSPEIFCSEKQPEGLEPDLTKQKDSSISPLGRERKELGIDFIKQDFGWFITQNVDTKFRIYENPNLANEYKVYFIFKNKHYLITISNKDSTTDYQPVVKALKGNQIQLQFNSLVKNEVSQEILTTKNSSNNLKILNGEDVLSVLGASDKLTYFNSKYGINDVNSPLYFIKESEKNKFGTDFNHVKIWGKLEKADCEAGSKTNCYTVYEISKVEKADANSKNNSQAENMKIENKTFYITKSSNSQEFKLYESYNCSQNSVSCNIYNLKTKDLPQTLLQNGELTTGRIRLSSNFKKLNDKTYEIIEVSKIEDANLSTKSIEIKDKLFYFLSPGQSGAIYLEENQNCVFNSGIDSSCVGYLVDPDKASKFSQITFSTDPNHPTMPFGKVKISGIFKEIILDSSAEKLLGPKYRFVEINKVEQANITKNTANSPFTLSGKGCEPLAKEGEKCQISENGKEIYTIRTCGGVKCLVGIEQGVKTDDYQYFYSPGYEVSGAYMYPFNIKTKKMETAFDVIDPCGDLLRTTIGVYSKEYKTCFESEKMKKYIADYTKYLGTKPQLEQPKVANSNSQSVDKTSLESQTKKLLFVVIEKEESRVILRKVEKDNSDEQFYQTIAKGNADFFKQFKTGDIVEVEYTSDQDYKDTYKQIKIIGEIDGVKSVKKSDFRYSWDTGKAQNYTNQFYPSLNIKYDDSWQMLTNNFPPDSGFEKKSFNGSPLLNRVIVLAKNGTTVSFTIYLSGGFGGGGDNIIQGNKISENIYRYTSVKNKGGQLYDYISKPTSTNSNAGPTYNLNSTLKLENGTPAVAGVIVSSFIADSNLLKEADQIVAGSSFGVPIK